MNSSLVEMLAGGQAQDDSPVLPQKAQIIRDRFPLNQMVPMIRRVEGKPSERVRLRRLVEEMQAEGISITSDHSWVSKASFQLQESYSQSGTAQRLIVRQRHGDYQSPVIVETLAEIQERMQGICLPIMGLEDGLHLREAEEDQLAWYEAGFSHPWKDFQIETALEWQETGIDLWYARGWSEAGYTPQSAVVWNQAGVRMPEHVEEWQAALGQDVQPDLVARFIQLRMNAEQAQGSQQIWQELSS